MPINTSDSLATLEADMLKIAASHLEPTVRTPNLGSWLVTPR